MFELFLRVRGLNFFSWHGLAQGTFFPSNVYFSVSRVVINWRNTLVSSLSAISLLFGSYQLDVRGPEPMNANAARPAMPSWLSFSSWKNKSKEAFLVTFPIFLFQRTEEQRLIYSGHLLNDASTLGQILRTADGQKQHTLHLVCTHHSQTQTPG